MSKRKAKPKRNETVPLRGKKWKKVLYESQGYPDNYVDPTFLSDMRKNMNLRRYTWAEAFFGVFVVTHEVSATILFLISFVFLKNDTYPAHVILLSVSFLLCVVIVLHQLVSSNENKWDLNLSTTIYFIRDAAVFLAFGYMFSSLLKSLTKTISTDTVNAMVIMMMMVHIALQDYGTDILVTSSYLSLNSALFGAVCLASRLPTVHHTFALVLLAVKMFAALPLLRKKLVYSTASITFTTLLFFVVVLTLLINISPMHAVVYILVCIFINIICPTIFVYYQKYKENIYGPWDEAVVKQRESVAKPDPNAKQYELVGKQYEAAVKEHEE